MNVNRFKFSAVATRQMMIQNYSSTAQHREKEDKIEQMKKQKQNKIKKNKTKSSRKRRNGRE